MPAIALTMALAKTHGSTDMTWVAPAAIQADKIGAAITKAPAMTDPTISTQRRPVERNAENTKAPSTQLAPTIHVPGCCNNVTKPVVAAPECVQMTQRNGSHPNTVWAPKPPRTSATINA